MPPDPVVPASLAAAWRLASGRPIDWRVHVPAWTGLPRPWTGHSPVVWGQLVDVQLSPNANSLPGGATLQQLTNGIAGWALILSLVALVIGAAAWAIGAHSQNYHQSFVGRRAVLVSGFAALLIGAAPTLINFFFHTGTGLH